MSVLFCLLIVCKRRKLHTEMNLHTFTHMMRSLQSLLFTPTTHLNPPYGILCTRPAWIWISDPHKSNPIVPIEVFLSSSDADRLDIIYYDHQFNQRTEQTTTVDFLFHPNSTFSSLVVKFHLQSVNLTGEWGGGSPKHRT